MPGEAFGSRLKHAWNAFFNRDPTLEYDWRSGVTSSIRPDRVRLRLGNERSIIASVYVRIALDVAATTIQHVRLDDEGKFLEVIKSGLNTCFTTEANIDQTGRALLMDIALSMFDEGYIAVVPVDTTMNPLISGSYDIQSLRTAQILQWKPDSVQVNLYNDRVGLKQPLWLPKNMVMILENPFYLTMNEPNSTLRRLLEKLNLLDGVDAQSGSGKLDLIIQLPYLVKTEARRAQAEKRRSEIEQQLTVGKYGIAYTDGTEKVTQLNRSVENKLLEQIESLTSMLYSQLGMTQKVFDGTADDKEMSNYMARSIEPIVSTIVDEGNRKFLTKTARSQNQSLMFFRDPFKFIPISQLPDLADKLSRNEIVTPNEFRGKIGLKASSDEKANELRNRNIAAPADKSASSPTAETNQNGGQIE